MIAGSGKMVLKGTFCQKEFTSRRCAMSRLRPIGAAAPVRIVAVRTSLKEFPLVRFNNDHTKTRVLVTFGHGQVACTPEHGGSAGTVGRDA